MSVYSDAELLAKLRELFASNDGTQEGLVASADKGFVWAVFCRLERFLHTALPKPVMEKGEEPNNRWDNRRGWAVVFRSDIVRPSCSEDVMVIQVDEDPGNAPEFVTWSKVGRKIKLRGGCVQQYRTQARTLRRMLLTDMKLRAAYSFADQHDGF